MEVSLYCFYLGVVGLWDLWIGVFNPFWEFSVIISFGYRLFPLPCSGLFSVFILSPCCFCCVAALLVWASEWTDPVPSVGGRSDMVQGGDCSPLCPECTQPSLPGPGSEWSPGIWQRQQDLPEVGG